MTQHGLNLEISVWGRRGASINQVNLYDLTAMARGRVREGVMPPPTGSENVLSYINFILDATLKLCNAATKLRNDQKKKV